MVRRRTSKPLPQSSCLHGFDQVNSLDVRTICTNEICVARVLKWSGLCKKVRANKVLFTLVLVYFLQKHALQHTHTHTLFKILSRSLPYFTLVALLYFSFSLSLFLSLPPSLSLFLAPSLPPTLSPLPSLSHTLAGSEDAAKVTRTIRSAMVEEGWDEIGAKERVLLLQSCEGSYRGWDIGGVGTWMRAAYHETRRALRPHLPPPLRELLRLASVGASGVRPVLLATHIRLGDCAFERWKTSSDVCAQEGWETTLRLLMSTVVSPILAVAEDDQEAARTTASAKHSLFDSAFLGERRRRRRLDFAGSLSSTTNDAPVAFACGGGAVAAAAGKFNIAMTLVAQADDPNQISPAFTSEFKACASPLLSSLKDDRVRSAIAVFEALDALSNADILVMSTSSFSRLAAALAPAATVKLAPFPAAGYPDASVNVQGISGVVEACGSKSKRPVSFYLFYFRASYD